MAHQPCPLLSWAVSLGGQEAAGTIHPSWGGAGLLADAGVSPHVPSCSVSQLSWADACLSHGQPQGKAQATGVWWFPETDSIPQLSWGRKMFDGASLPKVWDRICLCWGEILKCISVCSTKAWWLYSSSRQSWAQVWVQVGLCHPCPLLESVTVLNHPRLTRGFIITPLSNTRTPLAGAQRKSPWRFPPGLGQVLHHLWGAAPSHPTLTTSAALGQLRWEMQYFYIFPFKHPTLVPVAAPKRRAWSSS